MTMLARFFIRQAGRAAARRFEAATRDPRRVQEEKLLAIVRQNQNTEYGREHGFASVRTIEDWRRQVPVIEYSDIAERMERVAQGEKNILTAEDPVMFNQTSGTTGKAKYIPVTPTCRGRDHSDQMRAWIYNASLSHPGMFKGVTVALVSPAVEGYTEGRIPFGSASGQIYSTMPSVVRSVYAIPYEVFLIEDYEAKYYALMRIAVPAPVTFIGTANPSSILKMCQKAEQYADDIIRDVHDGTLRGDFDIDPALRAKIEARLKPDPRRARELIAARARRDGRLLPADYWPNLALIGCWKGGTVGSYLEHFPSYFDPARTGMVPTRDWGLLASEGRFTIPLSDHGSAGVLTVATNHYELVPAEDVDDHPGDRSHWTYLSAHEAEPHREYYLIFTTTGGLYRYDINDVVEVIGSYNQTPTLVFKRKGRGMTNITGEKLSVNQVIAAFESAQRELGVELPHFKAEPDQDGSRYVFKVEAPALRTEDRRTLLAHLERTLCGLNLEYQGKRKSQRLRAPVLQVMKPGWYDRLKQQLIAQGKRLFQAKTVLLDSKQPYVPEPDEVVEEVSLE